MTLSFIDILQGGGEAAVNVPDLGVRMSVWFIGMFLMAVGGAMLYLRLKELEDERKSGSV